MLFLSVLGLVSFAIENAIDLKIKTPFTIVLSYLLMQSVIASLIPTSNNTPLISAYVLASLFVSVGSTIGAAIVYYLANLEGDPPYLTHRIIMYWLAFLLYPSRWLSLLKRKRAPPALQLAGSRVAPLSGASFNPSSSTDSSEPNHRKRDAEGGAWAEIAGVLNRLFAVAYMLVSVALFVLYLLPVFLAY